MSSSATASVSAHDDLGEGLIALAWTLFSVAAVIIGLRLWTRAVYLKDRLAIHDWLMVVALLSEIMHCVSLTIAREHGLGRHLTSLYSNPAQIGIAGEWIVISESFSVATSYFGRMSFSAFLLSVVGVAAKPQRLTLWAVIIINTVVNTIVVIQVYAQCGKDVSALWNPELAKVAHCQPADVETYIGYVQASINSACDLVLTILPLTIVWSLKMPQTTKVALGALLTLSSFAFVASIAKAVEIRELSAGPDFTWHFAVLQYCVVVENDVVMIAASMPMLRALWIKNKAGTLDPSSYGNAHSSSHPMSSMRKKNATATVTAAGRHSLSDDEEHMLSDMTESNRLGGIHRTTETAIVVNDHGAVTSTHI